MDRRVLAGVVILSLGSSVPALAGPQLTIDIGGRYSVNSAGGLTASGLSGTYKEVASGTYNFANGFPATNTTYGLTLGGALDVNRTPVISGSTPGFSANIGNLNTAVAAIPGYGPLLIGLAESVANGGASSVIQYAGYDVVYRYTGSDQGTFSLGSNSNFAFGTASGSGSFSGNANLVAVPEPSSLLLIGTGLLGLLAIRRRKGRRAA